MHTEKLRELWDNATSYVKRQALEVMLAHQTSPVFDAAKNVEHEIAALNALKRLRYLTQCADQFELVETLRVTKLKALAGTRWNSARPGIKAVLAYEQAGEVVFENCAARKPRAHRRGGAGRLFDLTGGYVREQGQEKRVASTYRIANLQRLGVRERIFMLSMAPEDFRSVFMAFKACNPDEVYFLVGQSSVSLSFEQPAETIQSFTLGTLNVLEARRMMDKPTRQNQAGSSECFGDAAGVPACG